MSQISEEKLLTSALKIEQWYHRYKNILIFVVVILLCGFAGYQASLWYQAEKIKEHYAIYESLLKDPKSEQKREALKATGSPLYDLFLLKEAVNDSDMQTLKYLEGSKDGFISMIARYQNVSLEKTETALDMFLKDTNQSESLKDILVLQKVYFLLKEDKITEAHTLLAGIPVDSNVKSIAKFFEHYGITKVPLEQNKHDEIEGVEIFKQPDHQETGIENIQLLDTQRSP